MSDVLSNRLTRGQPFASSTRQQQLPPVLAHAEWWWRCVLRGWAYRCSCLILLILLVERIRPVIQGDQYFTHHIISIAQSLLRCVFGPQSFLLLFETYKALQISAHGRLPKLAASLKDPGTHPGCQPCAAIQHTPSFRHSKVLEGCHTGHWQSAAPWSPWR